MEKSVGMGICSILCTFCILKRRFRCSDGSGDPLKYARSWYSAAFPTPERSEPAGEVENGGMQIAFSIDFLAADAMSSHLHSFFSELGGKTMQTPLQRSQYLWLLPSHGKCLQIRLGSPAAAKHFKITRSPKSRHLSLLFPAGVIITRPTAGSRPSDSSLI